MKRNFKKKGAIMMEINAEINKVFGMEMAKLFADQITEEELLKISKDAWNDITAHPIRWREKEPSKLDELVRKELVDRLLAKVYEIMQETTSEEWIQKEAERIAKEAKEKSHEIIVNEMATHIKQSIFYDYNIGYDIANSIMQMTNEIVNNRR